tara:strand:- start:2 stop:613 length:612 start_codon:yes stop_codon:yes gene_type:complete
MKNSPYQDIPNDECTVSMTNVEREYEKSLAAYDQAMSGYWEACVSYANDLERYVAMAASYCKKTKIYLEVTSETSENPAAIVSTYMYPVPVTPTVPVIPTVPRRPQVAVDPDFMKSDSFSSERGNNQCRTLEQGRTPKLRRAIDRMEDECRLMLTGATSRIDKANFQVELMSNNIQAMKVVFSDENSISTESGPRKAGLVHSM